MLLDLCYAQQSRDVSQCFSNQCEEQPGKGFCSFQVYNGSEIFT